MHHPAPTKGPLALATAAVVLVLTAAALPTPVGGATSSVPSYPIGQDLSLAASAFQVGRVLHCDAGSCSADPATQTARAVARLVDETGARSGAALVGHQFRLHRACDGQSTVAPFTIEYDYAYSFASTLPGSGEGVAEHRVEARVSADDDAPVFVATAPGSGGGTLVNSNVLVDTGITYEASLASHATAQLADNPAVEGDEAKGDGAVTARGLRLDFDDPLAPTFTMARVEPAPVGGDGGFLGYVNRSPARVIAQARDPAVNAAGENVVQSCVRDITAFHEGTASVASVGFDQGPATVAAITREGSHDVVLHAYDHQDNLASTVVSFVLDSVAPATTVGVTPAAPTGKAGWYKAPGPSWAIACERDPAGIDAWETSPCVSTMVSEDGGQTWQEIGGGSLLAKVVREGPASQLLARSRDGAGNTGLTADSPILKVDLTRPSLRLERNGTSLFNNGWHNAPSRIVLDCGSDALSGCGLAETRTDNGNWTSKTSYECISEMAANIQFGVEDVAGNRVSGATFFGCDFTAPNHLTGFRVTTPMYYDPATGEAHSNVTPRFEWDAGTDFGVAPSGVRHFEVRLNGVTHRVAEPRFYQPSMSDGFSCVRVRAVDNAGNPGPFTPTLCLFVDRVKPTMSWDLPNPGTLYAYGTEISVVGLQSGWALVVGGVTTGVTVTDPGAASGQSSLLDDVHLIHDVGLPIMPAPGAYENAPASCYGAPGEEVRVDGDCVEPCDDLDTASATCSWTDGSTTSNGVGKRMMFARAWDNAHNVALAWQNYTKVELAVVESTCGSIRCNALFFERSVVPDFLAYLVELRIPGDPVYGDWQTIHTEPVATNSAFSDVLHPTQVGTTYEYRVHVQAEGRGVIGTTHVAGITATHQDGHVSSFD